jgi:hypothetical protein
MNGPEHQCLCVSRTSELNAIANVSSFLNGDAVAAGWLTQTRVKRRALSSNWDRATSIFQDLLRRLFIIDVHLCRQKPVVVKQIVLHENHRIR